ncbi:hypothetical protein F503_08684 [Ophiostoma piceae UAMH 11346]|uniref:Uncharacterized protein n=1 Tax=Ophiostoma piceae (strain UAMH 11346) TaxID=1262450 RepID=S3CQZ9_OPHP1|nr:hypothetical protein F503_08684 [Ophiostoma piceae UAMH 11346]
MPPPIDESVLRNNPDFALLYATLTTAVLNPDGSTKTDAGTKARDAVRNEAKKTRIRVAKNHLLAQAISTTAPAQSTPQAQSQLPTESKHGAVARRAARTTGRPLPPAALAAPALVPPARAPVDLPPDLLDLLLLLPPLINLSSSSSSSASPSPPPVSADDIQLLLESPPFTSLPDHLPRLASLVSDTLQSSALSLARVLNPSTNPSYLHRTVAGLPAQAAQLQNNVAAVHAQLVAARHATSSSLIDLLEQQASALSTLLRVIEAKQGGPIARSLELRASEVAVDAQILGTLETPQAVASAYKAVYSPEANAALQNYAAHLQDSKMRLQEVLKERKALLREYGVDVDAVEAEAESQPQSHTTDDKSRAMREMARVYREMGQQVQEVKGDLARLGRA